MKYSLDYSSFVSCLWCPSFSCAILVQIPFFFSTVSFSNEDNHCQLYATLDFVKFIVSICEQANDLSFTDESAFWTIFFLEIMLESWGCGLYTSAAYTRVFTIIVSESESNLLKHEGKYLRTELGIFLSTKCSEKVNENIFKYDTFAIVR